MAIKNPTQLLIELTKYPAAIEEKLPEGAPKLSVTLVDIANKLPVAPDFPMELPDMPAPPTFPEGPMPGDLRRNLVERVDVTPVPTARVTRPLGAEILS